MNLKYLDWRKIDFRELSGRVESILTHSERFREIINKQRITEILSWRAKKKAWRMLLFKYRVAFADESNKNI